jgi:predicted helicase
MYSVQMIGMGYDFVGVDCVVFQDPKMSEQDVIQCIGRGMRRSEEKKELKVVFVIRDKDSKQLRFAEKMLDIIREKIKYDVVVTDYVCNSSGAKKRSPANISVTTTFQLEKQKQQTLRRFIEWVKEEGFTVDTFGDRAVADGFYWALVDKRFYETHEEAVEAINKISGRIPQY